MEQIHFLDNFYYLRAMIRLLETAQRLPLDPALFADQIETDICFINKTIDDLYSSIKNKPYLRDKNECLHHILRLKKAYINLLKVLLDGSHPLQQDLLIFYDKWESMSSVHAKDCVEISEELTKEKTQNDPNISVSSTEMEFLLNAPPPHPG